MLEPVRSLAIKLLTERGHWRVEVYVDGQVDPTTIFGCRQGFEPMLRALLTADAKVTAVSTGSQKAMVGGEPRITVQMPSGRKLHFLFAGGQDSPADLPKGG